MRPLLFVVLFACGSERAPEPVAPIPDKVPVAQVVQLSPTQQLLADYQMFYDRELRVVMTAVDALRITVNNTKSDAERDQARAAHAALVPQAAPLPEKLAAFVKRARALPPSPEVTRLLDDTEIQDLLLKGVPMILEDIGRDIWKDQATVERERAEAATDAENRKLRDDAKAKLKALQDEKAEMERRIKEAKDATAKAKQK